MASLLKCGVFILLAFFLTLVPVRTEGNGPWLQRQRREWIIAPRKLQENQDYRGYESIARIRSDLETTAKITYELKGPGVNEPPRNLFSIDPNTGFVKIHAILDREERALYDLKGYAKYQDGSLAERDLDLRIVVEDVNDNTPVIYKQQVGYVSEHTAQGTIVMTVNATDADEENTLNSKIFYSIEQSSNMNGMFSINSETGQVMVQRTTLDRETKDIYKLVIKASDLNGRVEGNSGTEEIEIRIMDINDNVPTLEKERYEGSVSENTVNVEVMRIKAIDMDMIYTENWLAVYEIVSGNEAGYFSIITNSTTNEGIIMINKPLDYEEIKALNLEVRVRNKAEYNFGSVSQTVISKSYPIKINVENQKEGPRFQPSIKVVTISEDQTSTSINKVITNYAAIDSDTLKTATNVRYVKIYDADNWLHVDEKTADIKLNKLPDRESSFLINGTYYAKIICISTDSDISSKTVTGTIAIQVEDFNDHCPQLITTSHTMCLENKVIYVTAEDKDEFPNSAPFEFTVLQENSKMKWTVEHLNETTAILRDQGNLWPGIYKVAVEVKDQQGKSCAEVQMVDLTVCTCKETKSCAFRTTSNASFGAGGVLLLLLGLLLLLLVPLLLLFCLCGSAAAAGNFKLIPFEPKQELIAYHTEGQGEDKDIPLLPAPVEIDAGGVKVHNVNTIGSQRYFEGMTELGGAAGGGGGFGGGMNTSTLTAEEMYRYNRHNYLSGQQMDLTGAGMGAGQQQYFSQSNFDGMALSDHFLRDYYSNKSDHNTQQSQQKDGLLVYDYEGQESLAGSVGCCSLLEDNDDLAFLNDLGPKFKTLAQICQGSTSVTESADARIVVCPGRPVSPSRPSTSTHTHLHTHTETVRDRDHVNINTVNTSNVASGSSTFVQQERITERAHGSAGVPQVHVQEKVVIPNQTVLIQQPTMYYAATPMYVVDPQPQVMLVAGGSQQQTVGPVGQVALSQGLVQVGGFQGSQGVVLVDKQVGMGAVTGQVAQGLSQGTVSRSRKVLVVENGSSGGEQVDHLAQGFVQIGQGSAEQGLDIRSKGMQMKTQSVLVGSDSSAGSDEDFSLTATPKFQGNQTMVVTQKKISHISSTRA